MNSNALNLNKNEFKQWLLNITQYIIPKNYELILLYTNNGMFTGATIKKNIFPSIIQYFYERDIDNIHNTPINHEFMKKFIGSSFDILFNGKNKDILLRFKTFLELSISEYNQTTMKVIKSPINADIFRFKDSFDSIINLLDNNDKPNFLQLISYFKSFGIAQHLDIYAIFGHDPSIKALSLGDRLFRWGMFGHGGMVVEPNLVIALHRNYFLTQSKWTCNNWTHGIKTGETSNNSTDLNGFNFITKSIICRYIKECNDVKKTWCINKSLK